MGKREKSAQTLELLPPEQVFLFEKWPEEPQLVAKIKDYEHTGKSLVADPRLRDIVEAILNGASYRVVAKQYHVGRETLTSLFKWLEGSGQLRPFKERLAADWRETAALALWRVREAMIAGEMPLQVLPMLAGIATDKIELLTHSGGEEPAQKTIDITGRDVLERLKEWQAAKALGAASDAASDGSVRNVLEHNASQAGDTGNDTAAVAGGPGATGLDLGSGAEVAGGGDRVSSGGADGRGDGSEKF